jgi:hypothetical protein
MYSSGNCPYCSYKIPAKMHGTHPWPSHFLRSAWQETHIAKLNIWHYIQGCHAHTNPLKLPLVSPTAVTYPVLAI